MSFDAHITEFAGLEILDFPVDPDAPLPDGSAEAEPRAWRIDCGKDRDEEHRSDFDTVFESFLARVDTTRVAALVTGLWSEWPEPEDDTVVELLCAHADRFPALRAVFIGELIREQCEVSYIPLKPVTPLLAAYPRLEQLWVRGGTDPDVVGGIGVPIIAPAEHDSLCTLVIQSGGLDPATVRAVAECDFPALEHLEFYFGHPGYGGHATPADIDWLLAGDRLPNLRHLGLRDSVVQDDFAVAVAHAPVVAQLRTLDLSLGTLGDAGAAALLAGQPLGHLARLDLHHHYLSEEMQGRLRQAWPGVEIDLSQPHREDRRGRRYIAVAE
ncbi:STM4015 family protein [Catenulispora subtropica]|uniref:STM4015 family protein n=1 Tax=Catenulispora subtropica TaxID=450798 RepID=A0ABN2STG4_9ACTN